MGMIRISRKDTGKILSNVVGEDGWGGWKQPFNLARLINLGGGSYLQTLSGRRNETDVTFRFASRYPNSTLDNLNELIDCAYRRRMMRFRDLEGFVYDVVIVRVPADTESYRKSDPKHFSIYEIPITLERPGVVR